MNYLDKKQYQDAEVLFRQLSMEARKDFGSANVFTALASCGLSSSLYGQGRNEEAWETFKNAIIMLDSTQYYDVINVTILFSKLANYLFNNELYYHSVEIYVYYLKSYKQNNKHIFYQWEELVERIADKFHAKERYVDEARLWEQLIKEFDDDDPYSYYLLLKVFDSYIRAGIELNNFDYADSMLYIAVNMVEECELTELPIYGDLITARAFWYRRQWQLDGVDSLYARALWIYKDSYGQCHRKVYKTLRDLCFVTKMNDRRDLACEYCGEAIWAVKDSIIAWEIPLIEFNDDFIFLGDECGQNSLVEEFYNSAYSRMVKEVGKSDLKTLKLVELYGEYNYYVENYSRAESLMYDTINKYYNEYGIECIESRGALRVLSKVSGKKGKYYEAGKYKAKADSLFKSYKSRK